MFIIILLVVVSVELVVLVVVLLSLEWKHTMGQLQLLNIMTHNFLGIFSTTLHVQQLWKCGKKGPLHSDEEHCLILKACQTQNALEIYSFIQCLQWSFDLTDGMDRAEQGLYFFAFTYPVRQIRDLPASEQAGMDAWLTLWHILQILSKDRLQDLSLPKWSLPY